MTITEMSIMGGAMILAVTVVHALGVNRLPKRVFIALWEIVFLRLLLPINIPLPILPAVEIPSISAPSVQHSDYSAPDIFMQNYDMNVPDDYISEPSAPVMPSQPQTVTEPSAQIQPAAQTSAPQLHISLGAVYAVGATAIALFFVLSYVHGIKKFKTSLPVENDFVSDWLCMLKTRRKISVRYTDRVSSPLTYGILKPVILLPKNTDFSDRKHLSYILEHEYAHIRHFDALKKLIAAALLCVHWFNPLVWVMYLLYNRDMELWCDECVVRKFGKESRSAYARTLITMEELKCGATPLLSHFRKNSVEERIVSIMKYKKTTLISVIVAVVLITAITITIIATSITPVPKEAEDDEREQMSSTADDHQIADTADDTSNIEVGSFPISVFIDFTTSQKYYAVYDKYAVAIAPEDEKMFSSGEYLMTPEELDEWVHREIDRILGLTEGKMFYDSAANLLVEYDAIGGDDVCDTLNYLAAENLGATVGRIVAAPVFTVPVNFVFTERYVTPSSTAHNTLYAGGALHPIRDIYKDGEIYTDNDITQTIYNEDDGTYHEAYYATYFKKGEKAAVIIDLGEISIKDSEQLSEYVDSLDIHSAVEFRDIKRTYILTESKIVWSPLGSPNGKTYLVSMFIAPEDGNYTFNSINNGKNNIPFSGHWVQLQNSDDTAEIITCRLTDEETAQIEIIGNESMAIKPYASINSYIQSPTDDLSGIKNYFDYIKNKWKIKDEVPIIEDPELYAAAVDFVGETDVADSIIYPSISAVSGDEHAIIAVIEVDTKYLDLPEDIPEDAILQFRGASENFYNTAEWYPLDFISQNGTVYTYAYACAALEELPDEAVFQLRDFGYYDGEEFVTLVKGTYRLIVDADKFNTTEKLKKISKPVEVKGAEFELELTPFGLVVKGNYSKMNNLGLWNNKYFLDQGDCFDFYLRAGSVIGEEENFFDTAFYGLLRSIHGWVDFENDICYHHYGFMVPVDVEEIEAITIDGVRFDLEYAE